MDQGKPVVKTGRRVSIHPLIRRREELDEEDIGVDADGDYVLGCAIQVKRGARFLCRSD